MHTRSQTSKHCDQVIASSGLSGEARSAFMRAIQSGDYAVGLFDGDDRLVFSNAVFEDGWAIGERGESTFQSIFRNSFTSKRGAIITTENIEDWLDQARLKRRTGPAHRSFEVDLWDGRWMWITEQRLPDGWILLVGQDITPLKRSERMLRTAHDLALSASLTDPLTQLSNRRCAMAHLDRHVAQGEPFHLAILDVDSFKMINDRFGHVLGDDVLVQLGQELLALRDSGCFVARLAGDEFLIVSQAGETSHAFEAVLTAFLCQRARKSITDEPRLTFGISIGAATFPVQGTNTRTILDSADHALYRAKARGKSTLYFADVVDVTPLSM